MSLSLSNILIPIFFLVIYTVAGYLGCAFGLKQKRVTWLNKSIFNFFIPVLVFSNVISKGSVELLISYWPLVFFQILFVVVSYLVYLIFRFKDDDHQKKHVILCILFFQNAGYLPIALFSGLFSLEKFGQIANVLFIIILGFNLTIFSLGESLMKSGKSWYKKILNPPLISIVLFNIALVLGLNEHFPQRILNGANIVASFTVPLVMFSLGCSMYFSHQKQIFLNKANLYKMFIVRGLVFPLIGFGLVKYIAMSEFLKILVFVECLMPPAANLIVISRNDPEANALVSGYIYYLYLFSVVYIPLWLMAYKFFLH